MKNQLKTYFLMTIQLLLLVKEDVSLTFLSFSEILVNIKSVSDGPRKAFSSFSSFTTSADSTDCILFQGCSSDDAKAK